MVEGVLTCYQKFLFESLKSLLIWSGQWNASTSWPKKSDSRHAIASGGGMLERPRYGALKSAK
jgi:hypothetical protein